MRGLENSFGNLFVVACLVVVHKPVSFDVIFEHGGHMAPGLKAAEEDSCRVSHLEWDRVLDVSGQC